MRGTNLAHDGKVGIGGLGQALNLVEMVHAHLEHQDLGIGRSGKHRERHADQVIEIALGGPDTIALGEHGGEHVLGRRLADGTGNANDQAAKLQAIRVRQTQQKLLGIIGQQDGAPLVLRQRDQLGLGLTRHHDGAGTRLDGTGSKIIAVDVFTGKGDENRPFLDLARVDNAPAAYPIGFSRHGSGPCCGREVVDGDLYHCSSPVNLIMLSAYCIPVPCARGAGHVNTLQIKWQTTLKIVTPYFVCGIPSTSSALAIMDWNGTAAASEPLGVPSSVI